MFKDGLINTTGEIHNRAFALGFLVYGMRAWLRFRHGNLACPYFCGDGFCIAWVNICATWNFSHHWPETEDKDKGYNLV